MDAPNPLWAGLSAGFRHRRLALTLWLSLFGTALLVVPAFHAVTAVLDDSPMREALARGWDSWGMLTFAALKSRELAAAFAVVPLVALLSVLLHLALTGGLLRVLIADVNRPVLARFVVESATLFRVNLWAFSRYAVTLAFWEGLLVGLPVAALQKVAGKDAPPHGALSEAALWWGVVGGILVFLAVGVRFDLARIALARGEASTAREAYRIAKLRLAGARGRAVLLAALWIAAGLLVQGVFTNGSVRMSPQTDAGLAGLFLFSQAGFVLVAAVRVAYWGSFLAFAAGRPLEPFVPLGHPVAAVWPGPEAELRARVVEEREPPVETSPAAGPSDVAPEGPRPGGDPSA